MARTQGHGNPSWTRDETVLALDLYFNCNGKIPSGTDSRVRELSRLLRSLPYHAAARRNQTFRNPDGVAFKLQNLHQVATGKGLGNVSKTDRAVWAEFGNKREEVGYLSLLIRASLTNDELKDDTMDFEEGEEFFEGRLLTEFHKKKERHRGIRTKLLTSRRKGEPLTCDMCRCTANSDDPTFEDAIFEAHHVLPMAMAMERRTRLKDMALLCANCHRLLHRAIAFNQRWLTIEDGRRLTGLIGGAD